MKQTPLKDVVLAHALKHLGCMLRETLPLMLISRRDVMEMLHGPPYTVCAHGPGMSLISMLGNSAGS
jgi:hypothetical protein